VSHPPDPLLRLARWLALCLLLAGLSGLFETLGPLGLARAQAQAYTEHDGPQERQQEGQTPPPGAVLTLQQARLEAPGRAPLAVELPHEWKQGLAGFSGVAVYRMPFEAPGGSELLGVYVPRACSTLEVFVNGELVGSGGRLEPPYPRNCYYPNLFPLPRALLKDQGNELRIHLAGHAFGEASSRQRSSGLSAVQLGPFEDLKEAYDSQYFWSISFVQAISTSLLGFGLALLGLWLARRRDRHMLYFALFAIGWAALTARLVTRWSFGGHGATEAFLAFAFFPVVSCAMLFLFRLLGRRWRWMDWALLLQCGAVALLMAGTPPAQRLFAATSLYLLGSLEFFACVLAFLLLAWRRRRMDFWLVGFVLVQSLVVLGVEMAQQHELLPLPPLALGHFTMPLVFAVMAVRLIQLFVRALSRAETLNRELELRVVGKSREIERNWQQIAALRTAQAAQEERRRIASDLHDDLGAQLLTIAHTSQSGGPPERIAAMARQALEDMRLSVRGMKGHATPAQEAVADWRAETVTRLSEAGLQPLWTADELPPELLLPARTHLQLTRILREAVSNAIHHSGGRHCAVRIGFDGSTLTLEVQDDGRGMAPDSGGQRGHGLPNIERRVRLLGGEHRFSAPPGDGSGTLLAVRIPLSLPVPPPATLELSP